MSELAPSQTELATVTLICPLWGQVAEVTVVSDERGFAGVVGCPLSEPGTACRAPCEVQVRQWCRYRAEGGGHDGRSSTRECARL